jgi:hypothetical protein
MFNKAFFHGPWHEYVKGNPAAKFTLDDGSTFNAKQLTALEDVVLVQIYDEAGKPPTRRLVPYERIRYIDLLLQEKKASSLGFQA